MAKPASSPLGVRHRRKSASSGVRSVAKGVSPHGTDWDSFATRTDAQILAGIAGDPDAFVTDEAFWSKARVVRRSHGQPVVMRLDPDVMRWLRRQKDGDARVNDILRTRMKAEARSAIKRKAG